MNGDTTVLKSSVHRLNGFVQAVCLSFGLDCDDHGRTRVLADESPFERRAADRRQGAGRRATDAPARS